MKKYVFLTPAIGNFGGSQMYVNNKAQYLERQGWEVVVLYTAQYDNYLLPYLERFKDNYIRDFIYYTPAAIPGFKKKSLLKSAARVIGTADEIVLESHFLWLAFWGELIAKEVGARHIVNFLEEPVIKYSEKEYAFWEYKLTRWEFMNASLRSLHRLFKDAYKEEYVNYEHPIKFMCSNVVSNDIKYPEDKITGDFKILSVGRLDKPYVKPMLDEIKLFANNNPSKKISIFMVGGSNSGELENDIPDSYKIPNVSFVMLGYTFPVPNNLIKACDVAIATSNAVLVSADLGVPTISIDMNDYQAIGVFGYDTDQTLMRKDEKPISVSTLLEDIANAGKYPKGIHAKDNNREMDEEFEREIRFLERSANNKGYYDIMSLYSPLYRFIAVTKWFVHDKLKIK